MVKKKFFLIWFCLMIVSSVCAAEIAPIAVFDPSSNTVTAEGKIEKPNYPVIIKKYSRVIYLPVGEFLVGMKAYKPYYTIKSKGNGVLFYNNERTIEIANDLILNDVTYKSNFEYIIKSNKMLYFMAGPTAKAFGYCVREEDGKFMLYDNKKYELIDADWCLNDLYIRKDTLADVKNKIGDPDSYKHQPGTVGGYLEVDYKNEGITLTFHGQKLEVNNDDDWLLSSIKVTSEKYKTLRGACVGQSVSEIIDQYGMGYSYDKKENSYSYEPLNQYSEIRRIVFCFNSNGIVKNITIRNDLAD